MTRELHELGVRLMVSIWPVMRAGGADWLELTNAGHMLGNQATYDAFDRDAREMYWRQAEQGLFRHGIDAWWTDCTEPFEADWTGALKPEPEERLRINTEEAKRYLDSEYINAYSLVHSEGIWVGQRSVRGEARPRPDPLRVPGPAALRDRDLVGRCDRQLGDAPPSGRRRPQLLRHRDALLDDRRGRLLRGPASGPVVLGRRLRRWRGGPRLPGAVPALVPVRGLAAHAPLAWHRHSRELWRFGEPGEAVHDALVEALRLRYRLLPYIYSMAGWTTQRAYTMLRALAFDFRPDSAVHDVSDQFMFGPAFLVCPVVRPIHFGPKSLPLDPVASTRQVRLPSRHGLV